MLSLYDLSVSYVSRPTTSHEWTGDIITFASYDSIQEGRGDAGQLEEGWVNILPDNNQNMDNDDDVIQQDHLPPLIPGWLDEEVPPQTGISSAPAPVASPPEEIYDDGEPIDYSGIQLRRLTTRTRRAPDRLTYNQLGDNRLWSGTQQLASNERERQLVIECANEASRLTW
ncbi:MAG: hypothetical protein ACREBR_04145 [bacterium]